MDSALRVLYFLLGLFVVLLALGDLFAQVVVPRPARGRWRLSRLFYRWSWRLWRWAALHASPEAREDILGAFAPFAVIFLLGIWVVMLAVGYGFMLWALREQTHPVLRSYWEALYFSATSLLTIGYGDITASAGVARAVVLVEAGTGLGTVALVISMLFSLYSSFQRRESLVITLDASAGAPPSGVQLLETVRKFKMPDHLDRTFDEFRLWSAEVLESHLAYPTLIWFRSNHDNESWVSALGAVLDAANMVLTTLEGEPKGPAAIFAKVGGHLVEDLIQIVPGQHDHAVGIERFEFDEACARLERVGYRIRPADQAWADFQVRRAPYASPLSAIAQLLVIPPAPWMGDRSYLPHALRQTHD
ncbi:MAG TPA: potassium channel family protein [Candidatus Dormibacteraeota bacterium]